MDTNNITSKVISLIIPIILLLVVLVPITDAMAGHGGSGGSSKLSTMMGTGIYGEDEDDPLYYFYEDNGGFGDGTSRNVVLAPSIDGRSYFEGELVVGSEEIKATYHNGKFQVIINSDIYENGEYEAILLGYTEDYGQNIDFFALFESVNDIPSEVMSVYDEGAIASVSGGVMAKYDGQGRAWYCTSSENISITIEDYLDWITRNPNMGGYGAGYSIDASVVGGILVQDDVYLVDGEMADGLFEGYREFSSVVMNNGESLDKEKLFENASKPISVDKWAGWQAILPNGTQFEYQPQYLWFYTDMNYTDSGSSNDGNDSGIINTLIKLVPIFVALGILMSLAVPILTSRKQKF